MSIHLSKRWLGQELSTIADQTNPTQKLSNSWGREFDMNRPEHCFGGQAFGVVLTGGTNETNELGTR
ncbi:MAG: hypothetical protein WBP34_06500, partial [Thermoanaerobaculia bacterium]